MKDNKEVLLRLTYKLLSERISKEIEELYTIHKVFLLISAAILAGITTNFGNNILHIIYGIIGIMIAYFWRQSVISQERWRNWWMKEIAFVENKLMNEDFMQPCSWQKYNGFSTTSNIEHQAPQKNVVRPMHLIFYAFGIISLFSIIYGVIITINIQ